MTRTLSRTLVLLAAACGAIVLPSYAQTVSIHPGTSGCSGTGSLNIPAGGGTANFQVCVNAASPATKTCGLGYRLTASASNGMTLTARTLGTAYPDPIVANVTFLNGTNNALAPTSGNSGAGISDGVTPVAAADGILVASFTLTVPSNVPSGTYTVGPTSTLIAVTGTTCDDGNVGGASDFTPAATAPLTVVVAAAATSATFTSAPSTLTFAEGGATQNVTVTCAGTIGTPSPVVINVATTGTGFTAVTTPLSFATCPSSQTVAVTPRVADAGSNPTQTGNVTFSTVTTGATAPASVGVTVTDNQAPAVYSVTKTTATVLEGNAATDTLTVTCTGAFTGGLTSGSVQYAITGLTNPGDLAAPALTGALNFPACGGATQSVTISPRVNDAVVQGTKLGAFAISTPVAGTLGAATTGSITVNDDDAPPVITIAVGGSPATEAGGVLTYTVTRTGGSAGQLAAPLTVNLTSPSGPRFDPAPATKCGTAITIPGGAAFATCTVTGLDNNVIDGNVNAVVTIAAPTVLGAYTGAGNAAPGVITDDDFGVSAVAGATGSAVTGFIVEGGIAEFSINCGGSTGSTFNYTIGGTNTTGSYIVGAASGSFTCGTSTNPVVRFQTIDDTIIGNARTITMTISTPPPVGRVGPTAVVISNAVATINIQDNDAPLIVPTMSAFGLGLMSLMLAGLIGFQRRRLGR